MARLQVLCELPLLGMEPERVPFSPPFGCFGSRRGLVSSLLATRLVPGADFTPLVGGR